MGIFISDDKRMNGMGKGDEKNFLRLITPKLQTNETIEMVIYSLGKRSNYGLTSMPHAFVIATNKRVIFFQQLGAFKSKFKSFPYSQIKNIDLEGGLVFSDLTFHGTNNEFSIEKVSTETANRFVEFVENKRLQEEEF